MLRGYILRALLKKEALRYRYNWGLLVLVFALLGLSFLLSVSNQMSILPGQNDAGQYCVVVHQGTPFSTQWADFLYNHRAQGVRLWVTSTQNQPPPRRDRIFIHLPAEKTDSMQVRYEYPEGGSLGLLSCREWFTNASQELLQPHPKISEVTEQSATRQVTPMIFTGIIVFALYILSFNLFVTSTGEEREKKVMLALLLSPTSSTELIAAKAIFYSLSSAFTCALIVLMYQPSLLIRWQLWSSILLSSVGYIAVGVIALSLIRRQTTLSTVSILYMMVTTVITFLGSVFPLFSLLRVFLLEDSLYRNFMALFAGELPALWSMLWQLVVTAGWLLVALLLFRRRGVTMSR